jgi:hypothetical protein
MKTLIILILFVAILGIAYFTRPSERSFQTVLAQEVQEHSSTASASILPARTVEPDALMKEVVYKDRYLWTSIEKDGRTLYTGAFGHWFEHGKVLEAPAEKTTVKLPV